MHTAGEKTLVRVLGLNKLFLKGFTVKYTTRATDFPNIDHRQKNSPALQRYLLLVRTAPRLSALNDS